MESKVLVVQKEITKIHAVCSSEKFALKIQLSAGNCYDAPEGRKLIESINAKTGSYLIMDRAYEGHEINIHPFYGWIFIYIF